MLSEGKRTKGPKTTSQNLHCRKKPGKGQQGAKTREGRDEPQRGKSRRADQAYREPLCPAEHNGTPLYAQFRGGRGSAQRRRCPHDYEHTVQYSVDTQRKLKAQETKKGLISYGAVQHGTKDQEEGGMQGKAEEQRK